jgi:hypothetical protein
MPRSIIGALTHDAEVRSDRYANVLEDAAGVPHIEWSTSTPGQSMILRTAEIVHGLRPLALSAGVDLLDRAHFARFRLGEPSL